MDNKLKFSESQILMREAELDDFNYLKSTWMRSCRSNPEFMYLKDDYFYPHHGEVIRRMLMKSNVIILSFAEDPKVIIGFAIYSMDNIGLVFDWVYVKKTFRRMGVYSYVTDKIIDYYNKEYRENRNYWFTHLPQRGYEFIAQREYKRLGLLYNPFLRERN